MSGSGKTSAAKKLFIKSYRPSSHVWSNGRLQRKASRRVVRGYSSIKEFAAALIAGRKTKQGFKIAYQPTHETTSKDFDKFLSGRFLG